MVKYMTQDQASASCLKIKVPKAANQYKPVWTGHQGGIHKACGRSLLIPLVDFKKKLTPPGNALQLAWCSYLGPATLQVPQLSGRVGSNGLSWHEQSGFQHPVTGFLPQPLPVSTSIVPGGPGATLTEQFRLLS